MLRCWIPALILLSVWIHPVMAENEKLTFWDQQRKGANGDGGAVKNGDTTPEEWFRAAADAGIEFVRLAPVDWKSRGRDFLLGDADGFKSIPKEDLEQLEKVLEIADGCGVKIVLTMFSLPGARNRQFNNYQHDYRLWTIKEYRIQALQFWKSLAFRLKDHPAIVGYNPLNEPHPARKDGFDGGADLDGFEGWLNENKESLADLNRFNREVVDAIRSEDPNTPIILDCWFHSSPEGFRYLSPVSDDAVLYAFHYYGRWEFSTFRVNQGRYSYPNHMPIDGSDEVEKWSIRHIERDFQPVMDWANRHRIPSSRIIAEEFGCDRRVTGASEFLTDTLRVLNDQDWHWAFYSFRSSTWDGMDYELGTEKLGWKYWQDREKGLSHEQLILRKNNPLWEVIRREFLHK